MSDVVTYYLCAVNVIAFLLYGADKRRAKRGAWRISEAALIGIAVIGGSAGAWLGMKFTYGVPMILVVQAVLLMWFYF